MRVFGCTWKINFPEIIFSWPGVLKALTQKWFEVKIFTSNHFRTHAQREREREPSTSTSSIFEPTDLRTDHAFDFADLRTHELHFDPEPSAYEPSTSPATQSLRATNWSSTHWSMNPRTDFQPRAFDPWAFDFTGDLEPSRHEPTNRSLSLSLSLSVVLIFCVILINPRTHEPLISDFFVVVVVVLVVVFWWFSYCVVVGFVWLVMESSIFRMLSNTWKYFLEQFS